MAEDIVQPPRYTSTPLANRKTSNILNNFIEVSPIFCTPEKVKKAKSMIPGLANNEMRARSNGVRSIEAKTKVSTSTNSAGQGSSGSVKIPFQIQNVEAEKKNMFNKAQAPKKSSSKMLPPAPRGETQSAPRDTIDQAIESVVLSLSQKETKTISKESHVGAIESVVQSLSEKETITPKESHDGAAPTKSTMKTQVPKEVPEEKPQNCVDEASTKSLTQAKPQVLKAVSTKESRNSVDEVIDSVIRSLSRKETETSPKEFDAQDVPQTKSSRVSKISQRPSTLPSVPEEAPIGGTGQLSEDCIFKRLETQSGWLIPKETKTRVSLKRKSSFPATVTKRNKKIESNPNQDNESLFDSPEVPNLVEISSLCNKRQTYVINKKTAITDIPEECHKSVTDGIIPLERLSQKHPLTNESVKSTQDNSKKKTQKTITRKNNEESEQIAPKDKDKLEERNGGKENIEQYVSPNIKVYKNKRTSTKQPGNQLGEHVHIESSINAESLVKIIAKDNKPIKSNKVLGQEINTTEQSSKQLEVDIIAHQNKETKKKNIKSKKKEINQSQNQNAESLKDDSGPRRTLRERKPNIQYVDTSQINYTKEINSKKKKVGTVKSSQEQKENSYEPPPAENKSQRKRTVKGNKKSCVNSEPNELALQHHSKGVEDTDNKTLNRPTNLKPEIASENVEITVPKNLNNENKCIDKNNKKESENKKKIKKVSTKNLEIPIEEKKEQINRENVYKGRDSQQKISKRDPTAPNNSKKAQPKKQNSLANDDVKQTNETNVESQNAGALTDDEHLKLVSHGTSLLKSTSNDKTRSGASPVTKNKRKTVSKTSSVKHVNDENLFLKAAEEDADGNSHSTKRERSKQFVEEQEKIRTKTIQNKHRSKSLSRVKPKNSEVHESTVADKSNKLHEDENYPDKESCASSSGKKRKSEDRECDASHSESRFYFRERKQPPVQFWKNQTGDSHILNCEIMSESALKKRKYEDYNSGKVNNAERGFSIKDLFGMHEVHTQELQPGVVAARSIHIHNFVMMGEVCLEPGATLSKISTNTSYSVQEGTACVTITKHTKYFNASDAHRRFFIPKNVDVSITNAGNLPLKMEFVKFRG